MKYIYLSLFTSLAIFSSNAQVGVGTTNPDASAVLDVESNSQGMLTPRMTTANRNAIASPATGLLVFDTDLNVFYFFNGSAWEEMESTTTPNVKETGWVALNDGDSSFTLNFVNSPDLGDYDNFTHITLDFSNDPSDSTISAFAPTGLTASDFYDDTTHELTPIAVGDAVVMRLFFEATPANNNGFVDIAIDIGDTTEIIVYDKTIPLLRGNGRTTKISESIIVYQLGTFLANGAKIKIAYSRANQTTGTTCVVEKFGMVINRISTGN